MREKLIDVIEAYADFLDWDTKEAMVESFMEIFEADNNVGDKMTPTDKDINVPSWIPVTERLPSLHDDVLMYFKDDDNMTVGYLDDVDEDRAMWCAYSDGGYYTDCDYEPTHWMPLPEPPKED